ncbi:ribosomal protein L4/L1 family-domain-containing protein [Phakopsora pachyrhizi]|uniref:Large ribosomal subunit protein uL4m n=1 Tax=Phakopsora pachyrhizi TaxID=170000 RepID=A0AAV0AR26_PHAPC|nr:ribosomal protein L4/L1 family-domain-containing protein [Phakopsora pachyrhizi]CAH7671112.1 ribosomal protein L4/L1 family-domain-containing protein [Phakopsora pachyrhizi]
MIKGILNNPHLKNFSCISQKIRLENLSTTFTRNSSSSTSSSQPIETFDQPIEGITHGDSMQHVILQKFKLKEPSAKFDKTLVFPISKFVFGQPNRPDLIHRCVMFERSLMRSGSANTKTRSEVAMSGRKLRPQKGTGRARLGDASSPTLRKGGVAFGPKPKDWSQGIPRKVWELGLRTVLSQRWREGKLIIVDKFDMEGLEDASEELSSFIKAKDWSSSFLIASARWGTEASGLESPSLLRKAISRSHLIRDGIRLGQTGTWWQNLQRERILPILNTLDLAHPNDIRPGKPHPADSKLPAVGIYHLLLRKHVILDIEAVRHLEHKLTEDLRRPISALGVSPVEAHYQSLIASHSISSIPAFQKTENFKES